VTWGGDLGSTLFHYIEDRVVTVGPLDLNTYLRRYAGYADLLGDIDGINIGSAYDPTRSLADNLRAYYWKTRFQRFREFISKMKDEDGKPLLPLVPNAWPLRLSLSARKAIAYYVRQFVKKRLQSRGIYNQASSSKQKLIDNILNGSEMNEVVNAFVNFLEDGLAREA
jgi:hypothetical protein